MLWALFVCLILPFVNTQSHFIPLQPPSCPFSAESATITSIPLVQNISQCPDDNNISCCTPGYVNLLGTTDLVLPTLNAFFSSISSSCQNEFSSLGCIPCQRDSFVWSQVLGGTVGNNYKVTLCGNYCDRLYTSCGDSTLASDPSSQVTDVYNNHEAFCTALFQGSKLIINVAPLSEISCFDPYNSRCTADDIDYYYTECVEGQRNLRYNWKYNITCNGGEKLPVSVSQLPCPISCGAGSYLPLGLTHCEFCNPGTYSLGGGFRIEEWDAWPTRYITFSTYCLDRFDHPISDTLCSGWTLNGTYTSSNIEGRSSTKSVLETEVTVKQNSTVTFIAQIDSEYPYDRLTFDNDGYIVWLLNTIEPALFSFSLTPGYHKLKWIYYKDSNIDYGLDTTLLMMVEITALSDNSDYCSNCKAGSISAANSMGCTPCPMNTYNTESGSAECYNCSAEYYSYPGDDHCTLREACTVADYQSYYTPCSNNTRTLYYAWILPQICSETDVHLPPSINGVRCAPCNPGEYRDGENCIKCPAGWYSTGGEEPCVQCDPGTYAPKQLYINTWDSWVDGAMTTCQGDCGTRGWRLRSNYTDSGTNHGTQISSIFTIPTVIETYPSGFITYEFSLLCLGWCYLELYDGLQYVHSDWNEFGDLSDIHVTVGPLEVSPGPHNFTWLFGKFISTRNDDRAKIYSIIIDGVENGGAAACLQCAAGTASATPSDKCEKCSPGYYSEGNALQCSPCQDNTYQDKMGQSSCKPCGPGTTTPPGSTECGTGNCRYSPPSSEEVYDFSGLQKAVGMYGPLEQHGNPPLYYYLSPCAKRSEVNDNITLVDEDEQTFSTYATYIDSETGSAIDLGHIMGFYPYPGPEKGYIIEYSDGTPGCGDERNNLPNIPRRLNLTMICQPSAGIGFPEDPNPIYTGTDYPNVCTYHIKWRSIFGCPICTEDDIITVTEVCINGQQVVRYAWISNPPNCHAISMLPLSYVKNCTSFTTCSRGTYLSQDDSCTPCSLDHYSIGDGELYDEVAFQDSDILQNSPFSTGCEEDVCEEWTSGTGVLVSGSRGISWVELFKNFQSGIESSIEFEYKYTAQGSPFLFYIDSEVVLSVNQYSPGYQTASFLVSSGTHKFRWEYTHGELNFTTQRDNNVKIQNLKVLGTANAVTACSTCQSDTVSDEDRGYCHECPMNQIAVMDTEKGGHVCQDCPDGFYRLMGQSGCIAKPVCTDNDFLEIYPNIDVQRCGITSTFTPKQPQICTGPTPDGKLYEECLVCPTGTSYDTNEKKCKPCPSGTYLQFGQCQDADNGFTTVSVSHYFSSADIVYEPPQEFTTGCYGDNCNSGWRIYGMYADSGLNYGEVDSVLQLTISTDIHYYSTPTVEFTISMNPIPDGTKRSSEASPSNSGVEFYIDNVLQDFSFILDPGKSITKKYSIPGEKGTQHEIMWVYSQSATDNPSIVKLSDVSIIGSQTGVATQQVPCPAGLYDDGKNNCLPCKPGEFSLAQSTVCSPCPSGTISGPGSGSCESCGSGTVSVKNTCKSSCNFSDNTYGYNYDLTQLKQTIVSVIPSDQGGMKYLSYEINLCDKFVSDNCYSTQCTENSYIFGEFGDETPRIPRTLGTWLEFVPVAMPPSSQSASPGTNEVPYSAHTFDLVYTRGDNLPEGCTSVNTKIQFFCDTQEGKGLPVAMDFENKCTTIFNWKSLYACRTCTDEDKLNEVGPCENGKRQVIVKYKIPCYGNPSPIVTEDCEDIELERTTVIYALAISSLLLSIGVGSAIYFFQQKRNIEAKYELLRNEAKEEEEIL